VNSIFHISIQMSNVCISCRIGLLRVYCTYFFKLNLRFSQQWLRRRVFWVVTPCSSENTQHFWGTYHLHLQAKGKPSKKPARSRQQVQLEDWGDTLLWNIGLSPNYTALQTRRPCSSWCLTIIKLLKFLRNYEIWR
jgi:hypothetical protein